MYVILVVVLYEVFKVEVLMMVIVFRCWFGVCWWVLYFVEVDVGYVFVSKIVFDFNVIYV